MRIFFTINTLRMLNVWGARKLFFFLWCRWTSVSFRSYLLTVGCNHFTCFVIFCFYCGFVQWSKLCSLTLEPRGSAPKSILMNSPEWPSFHSNGSCKYSAVISIVGMTPWLVHNWRREKLSGRKCALHNCAISLLTNLHKIKLTSFLWATSIFYQRQLFNEPP